MIDKQFKNHSYFYEINTTGVISSVYFKVRNWRVYLGCRERLMAPYRFVCYAYEWTLHIHDDHTFRSYHFRSYTDAESWLRSEGYL